MEFKVAQMDALGARQQTVQVRPVQGGVYTRVRLYGAHELAQIDKAVHVQLLRRSIHTKVQLFETRARTREEEDLLLPGVREKFSSFLLSERSFAGAQRRAAVLVPHLRQNISHQEQS